MDMRAKTVLCLILVLICNWLLSINAILVSPENNITEGDCSGQLDYFLCNCTSLHDTIDIHLSPGWYCFKHQHSCLLQNKISIKLIGSSSNDTIIECQEPFNIVFMRVQNVVISNIAMVNCGNVTHDLINQTVHRITNYTAHLGFGFKFAIMFYQAKDVTITKFTMQSTLGYGIVLFNAIGNVTISKLNIENTTCKDFQKCKDYDYGNAAANSSCSGSGLFIIYHDYVELDSANTLLMVDQSHFTANRNFLPFKEFKILNEAINTGFYRSGASIPLQGAAGITVFYLQKSYDVNATITNSMFHNNNGTLSASIAIVSLATILKV